MEEDLIVKINEIKQSKIAEIISSRIKEFEKKGKEREDEIFSELCFCLMTANFNAEKCINIQENVGRDRGFELLPKEKLAEELKKQGHRFPNARAAYIHEARTCSRDMHDNIFKKSGKDMRKWLVENVKGLGMKEASHFLRNIGYKDVAIIDFHILDLLLNHGFIDDKPKTMTNKRYIEIEGILNNISEKVGLNLAELDLYLWYIETGKILK